jgi:hypothetical protein
MSISYTFTQGTPSIAWTINHNMGVYPACDVFEVANGVTSKILPKAVTNVDLNTLLVEFTNPTAGSARLIGANAAPVLISGAGSIDGVINATA